MDRGSIRLNDIARYSKEHTISREKLEKAIKSATDKLLSKAEFYADRFPGTHTNNLKYIIGENDTWVSGLYTGTLILAYELSGNPAFLDIAKSHIPSYRRRYDEAIAISSHDVGFIYSPSCVALYKLTGDEKIKQLALGAADHLYKVSYSQKGGFILRSSKKKHTDEGCRTMMDTLMNIPLFFWAYETGGDKKFYDAAVSQLDITEKHLIRSDGSSYHHYLFDVDTHKPVRGLTFQGHSDDSCWSRGQAWGVYGLPVAYSYTKDQNLLLLHRDVTYFVLNHMPQSAIPYYDYDFVEKCGEALDSSAGLISACGMLEACRYLPDTAEEKMIYKNAASMLLEAVIDTCADYDNTDFDGLVRNVTCSAPHGFGVNGCALYGDFFYLEALMRHINPDWERYW